MFEARGKKVVYLKRVKMAGIALDDTLAPGQWRELTNEGNGETAKNYVRRNTCGNF